MILGTNYRFGAGAYLLLVSVAGWMASVNRPDPNAPGERQPRRP
ncbi:hypothetical protein [Mycolicibacterium sediminis]|nr:hypothetical protein [Mycolicibacterium sediminis]